MQQTSFSQAEGWRGGGAVAFQMQCQNKLLDINQVNYNLKTFHNIWGFMTLLMWQ